MTEQCERCQEKFVEALYQELEADERHHFEAHLADCEGCRTQFTALQDTVALMSRRRQPEFSSDFWEGLEDRIQNRVVAEQTILRPGLSRPWSLALKVAAGFLLVLSGVAIDRLILRSPEAGLPESSLVSVQPTELEQKVAQFLGRSQLLLLALTNIDTFAEGAETIDLSIQKKVSRELLDEAGPLSVSLRGAGQAHLAGLVQDLEKFMLQIANLEQRRGLRQVRLVQRSLRESDLLVRVNLKSLRTIGTGHKASSPSI